MIIETIVKTKTRNNMNQKDYLELSEDGRTLIRCDKNAEGKIKRELYIC